MTNIKTLTHMTIHRLRKISRANKKATTLILITLSIISGTIAWQTLNQDNRHSEINIRPSDHHRLRLAVQNYWLDHQDQLGNTAQQISAIDFAEKGYLDLPSAERWESTGIKIGLPVAVTAGDSPSDVIVEATMSTGDKIVLLADGSVQNR
jgi:hypothetical protein